MKKFVSLFLLLSSILIAQPTIDGNMTEGVYTQIGAANGRDGFGSSNDLGVLKYYTDGTDIYLGLTCELDGNNNVVLFFDFSGYGGRGSNTLAGSSSSSIGVFTTTNGGLDGAKMDLDADFALAFNEGSGTTNFYLDYARFGSDASGYLNTGFLGSSDQSGNSTSLDLGTPFGGTGNISFAYQNDFSTNSNHGLEMKIPIAVFAGVTNAQTVKVFALITNNTGYNSNECIPGDPGDNTFQGDDKDFSALSGDFFTTNQVLPVELTNFSVTTTGKNVQLRWNTATETNNAGFAVQRREENEYGWSDVTFVRGNGTTNTPQEYAYTDSKVAAGTYLYRLKQIDRDGRFEYSGSIEVNIGLTAEDFELAQNYPNPFNPLTTIQFAVAQDEFVSLKVINSLGQEVKTLFNGIAEGNKLHKVVFDGSSLSSGIYYYSLTTGNRHEVKKLTLLK